MKNPDKIKNLNIQIAALHKEADGYEDQLTGSSLTVKQSITTCKLMLECIETAGTLIQIKQAITASEQPKQSPLIKI